MNVTIIGSGNIARAIGTRALAGGNSVTIVARNVEPAGELAASLQGAARDGATVEVAPLGGEIKGDVVVLAIPYSSVAEIIRQNKAQFDGKIVIDATNPLKPTYDGLTTPADSSAAEEIAKLLPAGARVVKAFNTTFANTLVAGQVAGQPLDILIASDDADAKAIVSRLVEAGGLRAIDAGPLKHAHQMEEMAFFNIALQSTAGTQFMSAWQFAS